jgi:hypothetical protein
MEAIVRIICFILETEKRSLKKPWLILLLEEVLVGDGEAGEEGDEGGRGRERERQGQEGKEMV